MDLHQELAELVRTAGSNVLDDPDALRAALDDFLADDAATAGELNLLVDAVRLGALARFVDQVGHGADPRMTIEAHGDQLAAARGTRESGGTRWALAALGYAVGIVDEGLARQFHEDMVGRETAAPAPVRPPAPPPPPPPPPQQSPAPTMAPPTADTAPPFTGGYPAATQSGRKRRTVLVVGAVAAAILLAVGVGLGVWLQGDDEPTSSSNDGLTRDELAELFVEEADLTEEQADCVAEKVLDSDLTDDQLEAIEEFDENAEETGLSPEDEAEVVDFFSTALAECATE